MQRRRAAGRWVDDPRLTRALPTVAAVAVFLVCAARIRQRWFMPGWSGAGYTEWVVRTTVDGVARAPNQYRPLMPWLEVLVADAAAVPLPTAIVWCDLLLLGVLIAVLHRLATRLGRPELIVGAAAAWLLMVAKMDHWHPEVMLLAVLVTATVAELARPAPRWWLLLAAAIVMCGARTDYAGGLAVAVLAVAAARRDGQLALTGVAIGGLAASVTAWLVEVVYPQAFYRVDVVQLPYNLTPGALIHSVPLFGLLVAAPLLLAARRRALPPLWPILVWLAVQLAVTFVVGRPDETRIFLPLAPALGVCAAAAWLKLRRPTTPTVEHTAARHVVT